MDKLCKNSYNKIPIFLSSDDKYAPFIATTIVSVCDNTKSDIDFYIIDSGITEENKYKIKKLKENFSNLSLDFLSINTEEYFRNIEFKNRHEYLTVSANNRFLIPYLKPELEKVLYLDVDIIVNLDIADLYNIDLEDYTIGAIPEFFRKNEPLQLKYNKILGLNDAHDYFNSGVLLINNKHWKQENILQKFYDTGTKYKDKLNYVDQDILNILYNNNYKKLEHKYNFLNNFDKELNQINRIYHYAGGEKPWMIHPEIDEYEQLNFSKNKKIFWKYAQMTDFYDYLIDNVKYKNNKEFIRKYSDEIIKHYASIFNSFIDSSFPAVEDKFVKLKQDVFNFSNSLKKSGTFISDFNKYFIKNLTVSNTLEEYKTRLGTQPYYRYHTRYKIERKAVVSVIIPIHNTAKYLRRCIESVLNQTIEDIEVICVNDCSTDNSFEVLQDYASGDNRVRIISFSENKGVSLARNAGLGNAKGEFIYFMDSDDWIDENYIEEMVGQIKSQNADIVINANYVNEYESQDKKEFSDFKFIQDEKEYSACLIQRLFPPVVWARMYRKLFLEKYNLRFPTIKCGEDIYFSDICDLIKDRVYVYKGESYHYFQHSESFMKQTARGFHYIEAFKMLYDSLIENNISTENIKLYYVESLIVDTEEKYIFIKNYFKEIKSLVTQNIDFYNECEKFVFDIIINTIDYDDFLSKYNPNTSISFVRNKMRKNLCRI